MSIEKIIQGGALGLILAAGSLLPGCAEGTVPVTRTQFKATATLVRVETPQPEPPQIEFVKSDDVLFDDSPVGRRGLVPCNESDVPGLESIWRAHVGRKVMTEARFAGHWCVAHVTTRRRGRIPEESCERPLDDTTVPNCPLTSSTALMETPAVVDFGRVPLGRMPVVTLPVTITSGGDVPLDFRFFGVDWTGGPFSVVPVLSGTPCRRGGSLARGMSCQVTVSFSPRALGADTSELLFHTNDPRQVTGVLLRGTGIAAR